jgi:hypothetical protein
MLLRPSIILSMLRYLRSFDLPRIILYFPVDHRFCTQAIMTVVLSINDKHMLHVKHFPILWVLARVHLWVLVGKQGMVVDNREEDNKVFLHMLEDTEGFHTLVVVGDVNCGV